MPVWRGFASPEGLQRHRWDVSGGAEGAQCHPPCPSLIFLSLPALSTQAPLLDVLQLHPVHLPARAKPQPRRTAQHLQPGHHAQVCLLLGGRKPLRGILQARETQVCAGRPRRGDWQRGKALGTIWCVGCGHWCGMFRGQPGSCVAWGGFSMSPNSPSSPLCS